MAQRDLRAIRGGMLVAFVPPMKFLVVALSLAAAACSNSRTSLDSGKDGGAGPGDGGSACTLRCELVPGTCSCATTNACEVDEDCVVVSNIGVCCSGCPSIVPRSVADSEPCLIRFGGPQGVCDKPYCDDVEPCAPTSCAQIERAACVEGRCMAGAGCREDQVPLPGGGCVPRCGDDSDCVQASVPSCCESCPRAFHRAQLEAAPCLAEPGAGFPDFCVPQCESVLACPAAECIPPERVFCGDGGFCQGE